MPPSEAAPVLRGVDFAASAGEFVAICGPNGAGKTTMLRALAGLLPGGVPMPRFHAFVEQGARCAWGMRIEEVVALGRIPHGDNDMAAIDAALSACDLLDLRSRRIDEVSGGQARRTMLARALATAPDVLLLDEPVADLDPAAAHRIMALLARLAAGGKNDRRRPARARSLHALRQPHGGSGRRAHHRRRATWRNPGSSGRSIRPSLWPRPGAAPAAAGTPHGGMMVRIDRVITRGGDSGETSLGRRPSRSQG